MIKNEKFLENVIRENVIAVIWRKFGEYGDMEKICVKKHLIEYHHFSIDEPESTQNMILVDCLQSITHPDRVAKSRITAFTFEVFQLRNDTVHIIGTCYPFDLQNLFNTAWDEIDRMFLYPIGNKQVSAKKSAKKSKEHDCQVPKRRPNLENWIEIYQYYSKYYRAKSTKAPEFRTKYETDDREDKPAANKFVYDLVRLQTLIDEGNLGHIEEYKKLYLT